MGPLPAASSLTWLSGHRRSCDRSCAACTTIEEQTLQHLQTWLLRAKCMLQCFATHVFFAHSLTVMKSLCAWTPASTATYSKDERTDAMTLQCGTVTPLGGQSASIESSASKGLSRKFFSRSRYTRVGGVIEALAVAFTHTG